MIRHAAAVVIVLLLSPSWVTAQGTELTVNTSSASVHKAPSTASPVIGQAARGTRLAVTRNVGDWVKVAWPSAADGVGYVRVSVGSVSNGTVALHLALKSFDIGLDRIIPTHVGSTRYGTRG